MHYAKHIGAYSLALGVLLMVSPTLTWGGVWDSAYEGPPGVHAVINNSSQKSTIDDHARNARIITADRLEPEHFVGDQFSTAYDNGLHRPGSARCYIGPTAPTVLSDSHPATVGLTDLLNTGLSGTGVAGLEDAASSTPGSPLAADDVGHGRCWVNTSDANRLYVYHGVAGDNTPVAPADGWRPAGGTGRNFAFHGSFEATDGDGDETSTTEPYGWALSSLPTISYVSAPVTEGSGLAVRTTSTSSDDGIVQTLSGLRSSSGYRVSVRVFPTTDVCQILIGGADRTAPTGNEVETSTTGAFVTLALDFFTDATPTDITVTLQGEGATAVCTWDNVIIESFSGVSTGVTIFQDVLSGGQACDSSFTGTCEALATVRVHPPGPGYHVLLMGTITFDILTTNHQCEYELHDGTNQLQLYPYRPVDPGTRLVTPVLFMTQNVLVPGTTINYELNGRESTGTTCTVTRADLYAILIPSGR